MGERIRLTRKDLAVGMTVPWDVYNAEGTKLLGKGQELRSEQMLQQLCQYTLYHDIPELHHTAQKATQGKLNVFEKTREYVDRLERIYTELEEVDPECKDKITSLVKDIQNLCMREADAVLAAVHVQHNYPYSLFHSLQCAYLSNMVARRAGFTLQECLAVTSAALLANIGMRHTQETLARQQDPPTPAQQNIIKHHPQKSAEILTAVGYNDKAVLAIILEHHERCDGSGYPRGYKREDICRGALVLAVADRYGAMISPRGYRSAASVKDALQKFYMDQGRHYDVQFSLLLIKELTVFPPGSFVKLTNGEIALVIYRGKMSPMEPLLKSIVGPDGKLYANPLVRDLSIHRYEIQTICDYHSEKQLNYSKLWNYV